jgi:adenosylcobinamide kinase/adenosylcobinamide-phosphate guanylyltransferase
MSSRLILVTGGARSGKSAFAERKIAEIAPGGPWRYIATAEALDDEMRDRITHHRARRGAEWRTVEAARDVVGALRSSEYAVLLDCITLWISNLMLDGKKDDDILAAADEAVAAARAAGVPVILVTNEVGSGMVPNHPLSRRFRDVAGWVNQRLALACDEVFVIVSGLPLKLR